MNAIDTEKTIRGDYHKLVRREVIPLVPRSGGTLLDVGGGVGATAALIKERGLVDRAGTVDLVDGSRDGVALDFRYVGSIEGTDMLDRIAREQGPFSVILALDVLEHLVDPWTVVARLGAALKPGGSIVASIPNVRHFRASLPLFFRNSWQLTNAGILDRTHLRFFVKRSAIELMTSSGLHLDEVVASQSGGSKTTLFRSLTLGLLNSFTDRQYLIRVTRPA